MKKITAAFLCVVFLISGLCGCGEKSSGSVTVELPAIDGNDGVWEYELSKDGIFTIENAGFSEETGMQKFTVTAKAEGIASAVFSYTPKSTGTSQIAGEYALSADKDHKVTKWDYIRQNREPYANIPYDTRIDTGGIADEKKFIKNTGCGICSACMMVNNLTDKYLSVEECVKLSYDTGANRKSGTTMTLLAPKIASQYGLKYKPTNSIDTVTAHLQSGGMAIVLVHKQKDDPEGLFTTGGHYMALIGYDGEYITILDPSNKDTKYTSEGRKNRVKTDYPFVYVTPEVLHKETGNSSSTKYYLFSKA